MLNGVRVIAILLVVLGHTYAFMPHDNPEYDFEVVKNRFFSTWWIGDDTMSIGVGFLSVVRHCLCLAFPPPSRLRQWLSLWSLGHVLLPLGVSVHVGPAQRILDRPKQGCVCFLNPPSSARGVAPFSSSALAPPGSLVPSTPIRGHQPLLPLADCRSLFVPPGPGTKMPPSKFVSLTLLMRCVVRDFNSGHQLL